jgi:hypothetical protein
LALRPPLARGVPLSLQVFFKYLARRAMRIRARICNLTALINRVKHCLLPHLAVNTSKMEMGRGTTEVCPEEVSEIVCFAPFHQASTMSSGNITGLPLLPHSRSFLGASVSGRSGDPYNHNERFSHSPWSNQLEIS